MCHIINLILVHDVDNLIFPFSGLCPECSYKLNYHKKRKDVTKQPSKGKTKNDDSSSTKHKKGKKRKHKHKHRKHKKHRKHRGESSSSSSSSDDDDDDDTGGPSGTSSNKGTQSNLYFILRLFIYT